MSDKRANSKFLILVGMNLVLLVLVALLWRMQQIETQNYANLKDDISIKQHKITRVKQDYENRQEQNIFNLKAEISRTLDLVQNLENRQREITAKVDLKLRNIDHNWDNIGKILNSVDNLPLKKSLYVADIKSKNIEDTGPPATYSTNSWKENLQLSWQQLSKLVTIRKVEQPVNTQINPLLATVIKEQIKLYLEQGRWAWLQKKR